MACTTSRVARVGVTLGMVGALLGAGLTTGTASAELKGTLLEVKITKEKLLVDGPITFPAGRVHLKLEAKGNDRLVQVIRLKRDYSFQDYRQDLDTGYGNLFGPGGDPDKGRKALNRAYNNVVFLGGIGAPQGEVRRGTVMMKKESSNYVIYDDSGDLPRRPVHLTVTDARGPQRLPSTDAKITAKDDLRFGGDRHLPRGERIRLANNSDALHFFLLQRVKEGTSRQDVLDALESPEEPDFLLKAYQESDVVGPGKAMNMKLRVPAGKYAVMCFMPDLDMGGMPHAAMGMVRMVHVE